jgi:hypothetical protein
MGPAINCRGVCRRAVVCRDFSNRFGICALVAPVDARSCSISRRTRFRDPHTLPPDVDTGRLLLVPGASKSMRTISFIETPCIAARVATLLVTSSFDCLCTFVFTRGRLPLWLLFRRLRLREDIEWNVCSIGVYNIINNSILVYCSPPPDH